MAGSITHDVLRWRDGDRRAQFDLERDLRPFLLRLVRRVGRRLDTPLKARIDSQGVVYAALHSFLTGVRKNEFPALDHRGHVKKVLTRLVARTLGDAVRWHRRAKRTPEREVPAADGAPGNLPARADVGPVVADIAGWLDRFEAAVCPVHRKAPVILELSLKGLTNADIARRLGLGLRAVQLVKQQMAARWEEAHTGEE